MSLAFSRGDIWNRGDPKRGALALWCACARSCGVPAFAVGTMAIPKESAVDTNSETASSYAIGCAMTRARTTALLNFSQCGNLPIHLWYKFGFFIFGFVSISYSLSPTPSLFFSLSLLSSLQHSIQKRVGLEIVTSNDCVGRFEKDI